MQTTLFVLVLALSLSSAFSQNVNTTWHYLDRSLKALDAALRFFDREHETINMDAILTTRAMHGQFAVLLRKIAQSPQQWNTNHTLITRLRELSNLAGSVTEDAAPYIRMDAPQYYNTFRPAITYGFWELDYPSRNIPTNARIWPYHEMEQLEGSLSNMCLGEMLGTVGRPACHISNICWTTMTSPGFFGYSLSHQLLYFLLGQMNSCGPIMERTRLAFGQQQLDQQQKEFCANMLAESRLIAEHGYSFAGSDERDLFMEDAYFCGILGFRQFFRLDWLESILSWQHPVHGCYSAQTEFPRASIGFTPGLHARRKRSERLLRHGCLSHLTAMAIGSLTSYVRYLLEHIALLTIGVVI